MYYLLILTIFYAFPISHIWIHRKPLQKLGLYPLNTTVLIAGIPFVLWDYFATYSGIWAFNESSITGIRVGILPIEEFLFFLLIPQSCLLIWAAINKYDSFGDFYREYLLHHFVKRTDST